MHFRSGQIDAYIYFSGLYNLSGLGGVYIDQKTTVQIELVYWVGGDRKGYVELVYWVGGDRNGYVELVYWVGRDRKGYVELVHWVRWRQKRLC